jgi:hypothetical protein
MKRVVSVSLGSTLRDYRIVVDLLGEQISIERIGTNGDVRRARELYETLDGQVDCLGIGGAVLTFQALDRSYEMRTVRRMISGVKQTPVVDGYGFKDVVERGVAGFILRNLGSRLRRKTVLVTSAVDRLGLATSFFEQGFNVVLGDMMFALGIPMPLRSLAGLNRLAHLIGPAASHLPMSMVYPSGTREDVNRPRFARWFAAAEVIAGDCNYITRNMPLDMRGKIIATNTTTARDMALFAARGVSHVITSTPRLGTRTFGTNVMEGVLVALSGKGRPLSRPEVEAMLEQVGWGLNLEKLEQVGWGLNLEKLEP